MNYQSPIKKILKYFIVFAVIYISTIFIPTNKMNMYESLMIAMIAAILFALLDIYYPSVTIEQK